tara:strand:- start:14543 stop:14719 length:177 start_codon:yes stop_codon:yes gene_type:complete
MNAQKIEILEEQLDSAKWELNYHCSKCEIAKIKVELFNEKLQEAKLDLNILKDSNNEC